METHNVFLPKTPFIMIIHLWPIFDFWLVLCADVMRLVSADFSFGHVWIFGLCYMRSSGLCDAHCCLVV